MGNLVVRITSPEPLGAMKSSKRLTTHTTMITLRTTRVPTMIAITESKAKQVTKMTTAKCP